VAREAPARAPELGEHTEEVLAEVAGLSSGQIGRLFDQGVVVGPRPWQRMAV
jgi:2-methylfumaryl-CoA isomerase